MSLLRTEAVALAVLGACLLVTPRAGSGQPPTKVPRIAVLSPGPPTSKASPNVEAFRQGLRDLGYLEGQNIVIEHRWADAKFERLPALAAELVGLKPDVIVAEATQASLAVKAATPTIPIVMIGVSDPVGAGLVASLARPGGNITGTSNVAAEVVGKQLEVLKEILPKVSRTAVVWNPGNPVFQSAQLKEARTAAEALGLELQILQARDPNELDRAFAAMTRDRPSAVLILADPLFTVHRHRIADLAAKLNLPLIGGSRLVAEAGFLVTYGPNYTEMARRAASYVDQILKGARPAELPVEQSTKFELVINQRTAKALGLTIPHPLLLRAEVVQ